jgi:23S rRNA pseudouridine1911/1915/1917 synthase
MKKFNLTVPLESDSQRLDVVLAELLPEYSRSQLSKWIKGGKVLVDGEPRIPRYAVQGEQEIAVCVPEEKQIEDKSEAIALDIVYEDEDILIINKPAGLTVHPGAGQPNNTLLNALLNHSSCFSQLPRAGIVHRLDKLTSGLMVIAKNMTAQTSLVRGLQNRAIKRRYLAVVSNVPITSFSCSKAIGRHPTQRIKMAVLDHGGRDAHTDFTIVKKYRKHSLLEATLSTGRTHQIRVHLSHLGYPIVGDTVYNKRVLLAPNMLPETITLLQQLKRQALHAHYLQLTHPSEGAMVEFKSPLPSELQEVTDCLAEDLKTH